MGTTEKKMYKVLRNVGVKKSYIVRARTLDDLYLDEYDRRLLLFYFEDEFKLHLKDYQIEKLDNLDALYNLLSKNPIGSN